MDVLRQPFDEDLRLRNLAVRPRKHRCLFLDVSFRSYLDVEALYAQDNCGFVLDPVDPGRKPSVVRVYGAALKRWAWLTMCSPALLVGRSLPCSPYTRARVKARVDRQTAQRSGPLSTWLSPPYIAGLTITLDLHDSRLLSHRTNPPTGSRLSMMRVLLASVLALASGCVDCRDDVWSRYLGIHIIGMPDNTASATLTVTSAGLDVTPCTVEFVPGEGRTFGEVVDDNDCEGTMAGFTTGREWFVGYPVNRTFSSIRVSYERVDTDGVVSGFDEQRVRPDWVRNPLENGVGCAGDVMGDVMLTQTGARGQLP